MIILKIFRDTEWQALRDTGTSDGAPVDLADGYIHFSTVEQAPETVAKHFAGQGDLMLLAVRTEALGQDLKWEMSRGDQLFPHLYRALRLEDIAWARPLPLIDGAHRFPSDMDGAIT